MGHTPQVGDTAPDFTLQGTAGEFTLSAHRGHTVVLAFYPGDETMVCTKQLCSYNDHLDDLSALDATVVGISGKDVASKESFARNHDLKMPLLADADKNVAKLYGVFAPIVGVKRAIFVIDPEGKVKWQKVHAVGLSFVSASELEGVLAAA